MFDEINLKKKTVKELKELAGEMHIKILPKDKKGNIIQLILENQKVSETAEIKKKELSGASQTSSTPQSTQSHPGFMPPDFFNLVPELPQSYDKNKLVLMVRDPYWGFIYWDLNHDFVRDHQVHEQQTFLRVYDISDNATADAPNSFFDIKIVGNSNNWYVQFPEANRTFVIDYGYFKDGQFITLLRSNVVTTPRDDVSDQLDQEWMINDDQFAAIMKASGADSLFQQVGSQELLKFLAGNINEEVSSGSVSASGKKVK